MEPNTTITYAIECNDAHDCYCTLQVWLQYFAWTERSLSTRVEQRNELGSLQDRSALAEEPMFCFETAVKLLYWCGLVYELDEVPATTVNGC